MESFAKYSSMAFYINLDSREDRRREFEEECSKMDIVVERFPAIRHDIGALGCTDSHIAVLKLAKERGLPYVIIFEDDFQFLVLKDTFKQLMSQIPSEFDVIMMSYFLREWLPYNDVFGKVAGAYTTSGYIVHNRFYDTLINRFEESARLLGETEDSQLFACDTYWQALQPTSEWFYFRTRIGHQRPSYSDIEKRFIHRGV